MFRISSQRVQAMQRIFQCQNHSKITCWRSFISKRNFTIVNQGGNKPFPNPLVVGLYENGELTPTGTEINALTEVTSLDCVEEIKQILG